MNYDEDNLESRQVVSKNKYHGSLTTYTVGFTLSIFLTLISYVLVVQHVFSYVLLVGLIITLALVQFVIQMVYFLNVGKESRPRLKLFVLIFMSIIVLILVVGSLWIMNNLNYRMLVSPTATKNYLNSQDGL